MARRARVCGTNNDGENTVNPARRMAMSAVIPAACLVRTQYQRRRSGGPAFGWHPAVSLAFGKLNETPGEPGSAECAGAATAGGEPCGRPTPGGVPPLLARLPPALGRAPLQPDLLLISGLTAGLPPHGAWPPENGASPVSRGSGGPEGWRASAMVMARTIT
jgi:hypothetical protein